MLFIVIAPLLGLVLAYVLMIGIYWIFRNSTPKNMDVYFRKLQLASAAIFSFSHGTNDAQKTMGIITGVLVTSGYLKTFNVPIWVILAAHAAIALGTLSGGWRIVHTMGSRLTRLKPRSGFCAETAAAHLDPVLHRTAHARLDHPRDRRRHRRCGFHPAAQSRTLGNRGEHPVGLVADDSGRRCRRLAVFPIAAGLRRESVIQHASSCAVAFDGSALLRSGAQDSTATLV